MKRITLFLSLVFIITSISFTSCEEDKYLDWKYMNEQWMAQQKDTIITEKPNQELDTIIWRRTDSGLRYRILEGGEGIGTERPNNRSYVNITYSGRYINDEEFDSGINIRMSVSTVPLGLGEGLKMMRRNAVYEFRIPWNIAYGKDGYNGIPPYTALQFKIVMNDFYTQ